MSCCLWLEGFSSDSSHLTARSRMLIWFVCLVLPLSALSLFIFKVKLKLNSVQVCVTRLGDSETVAIAREQSVARRHRAEYKAGHRYDGVSVDQRS